MAEENAIIEVLTELEQVEIVINDLVENVTINISEVQGPEGPIGVAGPPGAAGPPGTAMLLEALAPLPDGLNVVFLASAAIAGEMVLINGIAQQPVAHYLIDGLEVHFDDPPEVGDILQILRTS